MHAPPGVRLKRVPALDGLRGLAAITVLAIHAMWLWFSPAHSAVNVFFVLSGFLIGGILMDTVGQPGWLKHFYIRRTLRIWPLYFVIVAAVALTGRWYPGVGDPRWNWAIWLFCGNFAMVHDPAQRGGILWSLAIEEHFYLFAPFIFAKMKRADWPAAFACIAVASVASRIYYGGADGFFITFSRLDSLSAGVLAAWAFRERPEWAPSAERCAESLLPVVIAVALITDWDYWVLPGAKAIVMQLIETVAFAACILALAHGRLQWLAAPLASRVLVFLGGISYGIYMYHGFGVEYLWPRHGYLVLAIALATTVPLAWASWRWFEGPILRLAARR